MNLGSVVLQIRAANTRFTNKVAGAAELALAQEFPLIQETAFVVQVADKCPPNNYDSSINQLLTERIAVIVALENDSSKKDILGFEAYSLIDTVRNELFVALLGWQPTGSESLMYYAGGRLVSLDRAWLWYQFEFEAATRLQALYDPDAGALPYLTEFFTQWKPGGDPVLPLPDDESLPTELLSDPTIEELVKLPAGYDPEGFSSGFETIQGKINKLED